MIRHSSYRTEHPSNRLFRGECKDFPDAIDTYIAALNWELADCNGDEEQFAKNLRENIAEAQRFQTDYNEALEKMRQALAKKWRKERSDWWAELMLNDDYTRLAV